MSKVKVRIAVAVDSEGDWCADGHIGRTSGESEDFARQSLRYANEIVAALYWLTAELDIPEAQEVQATVESRPPICPYCSDYVEEGSHASCRQHAREEQNERGEGA